MDIKDLIELSESIDMLPQSNQILTEFFLASTLKNLSHRDLETIIRFVFAFNCLESKILSSFNNKKYSKIDLFCEKIKKQSWFNIIEYENLGFTWSNKFLDENQKERTEFLQRKFSKYNQEIVLSSLKDFKSSYCERNYNIIVNSQLLKCYLIIMYNLRNRLYHGSISLFSIPEIISELELCTRYISKLIEDICIHNFMME